MMSGSELVRKELLKFNMLGGVDTKKLFPLKILDKAGIKKSFLTQYLMRG